MRTTTLTPIPLDGGYSPAATGLNPAFPRRQPFMLPGTERARRRHLAYAVVSFAVVFILFITIAIHGYIAWMLANPYVAPLSSNPMDAKGLSYTDIIIPSKSGKTLVEGWYIPAAAESQRTVVFSHGYGANREETWVPMYELAELMHSLKYNVILFDYGYASTTHKSPATGGYEESQQLLSMVDHARTNGASEVIVWGFSMGAGTALQAALQAETIDAMILDSLFLPDPDTLFHNVTQLVNLPQFPSMPLIQALLPLWSGTNFGAIPIEQVKNTAYTIPIYMMHGTSDKKAPVETAEALAALQTHSLSDVWIVQDGHHEMLFRTRPKEYIGRIAGFLGQVHHRDTIN